MFNKEENSNKFQIEAWTNKKRASKSLKKMDEPFKAPKEDRDRAAQIEAVLKKCNPDILDRINRGNFALENEKQMDNPFDVNKDKPNADDVTEDMKDSESSLSSKMASLSPRQYSNRSLGKKPMLMEANQEEGWRTVVHRTKKHVLFVQALDIPEKIMEKKVGWIYNLLGDVRYLLGAGLSVIEAVRQNVLATFLLKNNSNKLPLAASGSFSSPLASSSSPVKVFSKRHTWVSPSVVSTTSKSPRIFNNRPVNKLVFPALTTPTITSTTTASQMAVKAKNSKKQQQAVATAMVTPNPFVVLDEIFSKISTAAASLIPDMDGNSSGTSPKMGQDQLLAVLSDVVLSSRLLPIPVAKQFINLDDLKDWADQMEMESTNVNGHQRFSGWVASNLVPGAMFKIKMALLSSLFQLLPGCIGLKSVSRDAVKLFCVEFASQECLNGATKVAIGDEVFLTTLKIAWSSGVASVSSPFLSVALCNVSLGASSDDIKSALGIFGVVTSDISSAAAALSNWSMLARKDSVRILPIANQKEIISSRDAFKAKLVNLPFGCTAFEISDLVSQVGGHMCFIPHSPDSYRHQCFAVVTFGFLESLNAAVSKTSTLCGCRIWWETPGCQCCYRCQSLDHLAVDCKVLPPLPPKFSSNSAGGPIIFKSSLVGAKSYAKAVTSVVPPVAAAADMGLAFSTSPKVVVPLLPVASSGSDVAVNARLASLETQLSELSLLIKSIVEPVGSLVALVTMLLSTPPVMAEAMKESVIGLGNQIKAVCAVASVLQKEVRVLKLRSGKVHHNISDDEDMDDDDDDNNGDAKDFLVTFDAMMELWEVQSSNIKSDSDQTAKWMSSLVKSSHELVCIMGKMYELDMFNTLGSKGSTSM
ncbi:hypothetical protein G9A89_008515 [Geosiphon pyriformis]|nr:hypothetical protein G9A89_008515 [Geosiphon pyriformis]